MQHFVFVFHIFGSANWWIGQATPSASSNERGVTRNACAWPTELTALSSCETQKEPAGSFIICCQTRESNRGKAAEADIVRLGRHDEEEGCLFVVIKRGVRS